MVGTGLIIASVAIFVAYIVWLFASGNGTNENLDTGHLFMAIIICVVIFALGATMVESDSWNHHCQTCNGVLMDSKTVSEKFWGEVGTKIILLMEEIGVSVGAVNCPGWGEKMGLFPISYTRFKHIQGDWLITAAVTDNMTSEENLEIDVCNECMMLWLDGGESSKLRTNVN